MSRFSAPNALIGISLVAVLSAACTAIFTRKTPSKMRQKVVNIALAEPSKNPRIDEYWRSALSDKDYKENKSQLHTKDWCGIFILWALHQAGLAQDIHWKIGEGFFSYLKRTSNPQPGDIAYFTHNQHEAIVKEVHGNTVELINGNGTNGWITQSEPAITSVTAFYSIEPLISKALS